MDRYDCPICQNRLDEANCTYLHSRAWLVGVLSKFGLSVSLCTLSTDSIAVYTFLYMLVSLCTLFDLMVPAFLKKQQPALSRSATHTVSKIYRLRSRSCIAKKQFNVSKLSKYRHFGMHERQISLIFFDRFTKCANLSWFSSQNYQKIVILAPF